MIYHLYFRKRQGQYTLWHFNRQGSPKTKLRDKSPLRPAYFQAIPWYVVERVLFPKQPLHSAGRLLRFARNDILIKGIAGDVLRAIASNLLPLGL
ncbi:MAG: hypothetical protein C4557_10095 [Anaerolineaceae bacterium]|jgi:hypothetical protein|nr:MAG: hypothetical protein C4557_10095 [Anaerolineaceae bacterium]